MVFGVDDATLGTIKGALEAVAALAGHEMAETDPELGANLMMFFFRDWAELRDVPNLGEMIPDLDGHGGPAGGGGRRRNTGRSASTRPARSGRRFVFVRDGAAGMETLPAETIALSQAVQAMLTWGEAAFARHLAAGAAPRDRGGDPAPRDRGADPRGLRSGAARGDRRSVPCAAAVRADAGHGWRRTLMRAFVALDLPEALMCADHPVAGRAVGRAGGAARKTCT